VVNMMIPVRCISCGRPLAGLWEKYKREIEKGRNPKEVLDELGITSYCCRAMFLTHRDTLEKTAKFRV